MPFAPCAADLEDPVSETDLLPLESLAKGFSDCAEAIRRRRTAALRARTLTHQEAQRLMEQEEELRLRADRHLLEAALRVPLDLEEAQGELQACVARARERMDTVQDLGRVIEVAADLLVLASALQAGKAGPILAAFEELRGDLAKP